ncbi:MAG: hypothetical protein IJV36_00620 [Prevotella sp.]|nr:hypothetical protein [Prevotella sp.]
MKKIIQTLILVLAAQFSFSAEPDSLRRDLEDYDYLVNFIEDNYAPFDAIMQKGYKREYKALKKQLRRKLNNGEVGLERAATDYVLWFYNQFDRHVYMVESDTFDLASQFLLYDAAVKSDGTLLNSTMNFEIAPKPVSCKVDSLTWLIRVPSCEEDFYDGTVRALQQFMASDCENLIIDIRWNGGGGDNVWDGYYDLLYDHPYKPEAQWFRNTPKNLLFWKDLLDLQPSSGFYRRMIETCETSKKKFVKKWETDGSSDRQPSARIKRAAILVNFGTGSAAESLAGFVKKHSDRAKVYGVGNTYGCELTGSCRTERLPNSKLGVLYATEVDSRFYEKDFSSEGVGISPDVIIPLPMERKLTDNIDEWVLWVAKDLEK